MFEFYCVEILWKKRKNLDIVVPSPPSNKPPIHIDIAVTVYSLNHFGLHTDDIIHRIFWVVHDLLIIRPESKNSTK